MLSDFKNMEWPDPADTAVTSLATFTVVLGRFSVSTRAGELLQEASANPRARAEVSLSDFFMLDTVSRRRPSSRDSRCVSVCE